MNLCMCISMQEFQAPGWASPRFSTIETQAFSGSQYRVRGQRDSTLMDETKGVLNAGVTTGVQDRIVEEEGGGGPVCPCGRRRDARDHMEVDTLLLFSSKGLKGVYPL